MRFEQDGTSLWYGTRDAPAPVDIVAAGTETSITMGVQPADASNKVEVLYRVNGGEIQTAAARWLRSSASGEAQYFEARLGPFRDGDTVEYLPACTCVGRRVPLLQEATTFPSSFRVIEAVAQPATGLESREALLVTGAVATGSEGSRLSPTRASTQTTLPLDPTSDLERRREALINPAVVEPTLRPLRPAGENAPGEPFIVIPESGGFVVRGTVESADGQPLSGAVVRAFDRVLRKEQPLGEATTDDRGQYIIRYGSEQFAAGDVSSAIAPSLIVRAFAGDQQIGEDVIPPKPTRDERIDFQLPAPVVSEWERVCAGVIPLLKGQGEGDQTLPPWEINDSDLNFIAEETGLEREQIRLWALAFAVGRDAAVVVQPATVTSAGGAPTFVLKVPGIAGDLSTFAIFYGWFRQGMPTDWEALRLQPISTLRKALLDAIDQNIVPHKLREDVENILARIPNPQIIELATVLGGAALSQEKMRAVLTQVDAVEAVSDEVLTRLVEQKAFAAQEAELVGLNVSLHRLAGGEPSIVSVMLESEFASVKTGKLQHARDLASLEPEDWERLLEKAGAPVPEGMARADYARGLAMEAVGEFPQAAFKQHTTRVPTGLDGKLNKIRPLLEKNKEAITLDFEALDLAGVNDTDREAFREAHTTLRSFANLHPGMGLHEVLSKQGRTANAIKQAEERIGWLRTVFELNPEVSFLGLDYLPDSADLKEIKFGSLPDEARAPVLADLRAHQRIYSVANNPIPALEIMQAGFHSASAIALARKPDFAEKTGLPEGEASTYHAAALEVANGAALQWIKLYDDARDKATTPIRAIPSKDEFFRSLTGFQELINKQPWCACAHCQSVLSPAAYFVDLMYYIEEHILKDSFKSGREKHPLHLKVRRPDLWELELTCKNTNEYVPYLDVVNEVLEAYLRGTLSVPLGTNLAGTNLYKHLAEQEGSFQQPFTLPIERLEILLGHFGLSRYAIAKAMGSDRKIQARARLKISQKEYDLITIARTSAVGPPSPDDLRFFNQLFKIEDAISISSWDTVIDPMEMQTFLHATGLAHEIVESVLKSAFVNTDGSANAKIDVVLGKRAPDDVQNNSELVKNVTLRRLDRMHRFVRLWRKLPWTVEELDYVLTQLAIPDPVSRIDAGTPGTLGTLGPLGTPATPERTGTLEKILELLDLNAEWSLPIDELIALSGVFPPKGLREPTSLFDRLFNQPPFLDRDGRWPDKLPIRFVHPAWKKTNIPHGFSDPNNNTLTRLLAGLQVRDKELVTLIESLADILAIGYQSATATADESISLTKESIGILYRHARLMRLLKSTVTDFVKLIKLTPRISTPRITRPPAEQYIRDLDDVKSVIEFAAWQRASGFSLDEIIYVTGGASPEGALDPATLASEIVASIESEKSFEFADTVFTQLGLTDLQSRQIVLANLNKAFEVVPDGYCLKAGFDPASTPVVTLDPSISPPFNPPVDGQLVTNLLRKYHPIHVLDVALASVLNLSPEETRELRELTYGLSALDAMEIASITADMMAITTALQGGPDKTRLTDLISDTLRYRVLFKSEVFKVKSLRFVRSSRAVFFGPPSTPRNNRITMQVVRNVAAYVALAASTDTGFTTASDPADIDALQIVLQGINIDTASEADLAKTLRTDKTRIGALKPHLIKLPGNPFDALDVLARCLVFTEQLGVSGEALSLMIKEESSPPATFDRLSRAAEDVFGAFRAKYPQEKILQEKVEPFEDKLRTRKRDGLVDFVVSKWPEPFADANKLYEYFLIDVLLEGCARTSRVVAGISSLQLYVHRVLMNLEKSADLVLINNVVFKGVIARFQDSDKRKEWYWRENYRVWEANRKVFLYPENYIEPELRDDKTPLFKEIEDTLLQQEISDSNVHDAYAKYLTGFDEVARLKIAGTYYDQSLDELHLFGVTQDAPPVYYYRTIEKSKSEVRRISAWQKLSLQIPVQKVSPILFEDRLYVFWLETTTRPHSIFVEGRSEFNEYRHNIRIKYSTLRADGAWTPPQSLRFEKDGAIEDSRIVDDPKIPVEADAARTARIAALKKSIPELELVENAEKDKVKKAEVVLGKARKNAKDALWLANHPQDWLVFWDKPTAMLKLGAVEVWIAGNEYLLTGYKSWVEFKLEWPLKDVGNAALVLSATVMPPEWLPSLMARDATKLMEEAAQSTADEAERARQTAEDNVTKDETELARLEKLPPTRDSVRWDRSKRDHTEPLDNYKPEGWEWDRVYPDVYSPPNPSEAKSIRLILVPRSDMPDMPNGTIDLQNAYTLQVMTANEVDLSSGVLQSLPQADLYGLTDWTAVARINNSRGALNVHSTFSVIHAGPRFFFASWFLNGFRDTTVRGTPVAHAPMNPDLQVVNGDDLTSVIIESKGYAVWMRKIGGAEYLGTRLGTTLTATLTKEFGRKGASSLLAAHFQDSLNEFKLKIFPVAGQSDPKMRNPFHFTNPYLAYFRETFFHIPFLVANHLNSQQKFAETQRWYHYIFDPTAADDLAWRYREFRDPYRTSQSLRKMLTDEDALAAYRADPFNPHAIARTRLSAYQKSIVMKYIDNLLDWGDSLFSQFTMESVNEATMLYVMAQDILGPKPRVLGSCGEGKVSPKNYNTIRPGLDKVSDFLIELEPLAPLIGYTQLKLEGEAGRRVISFTQTSMQASTMSSGVGAGPSTTQLSVVGSEFNQTGGKYWTNVGGTPVRNLYDSRSGVGTGGPTILGTDSGASPIPDPGNIDFINPDSGIAPIGVGRGDKIEPFDQIRDLDVKYDLHDRHPPGAIIPMKEFTPPKFNPVELVPPKDLVFCIPPNKDLLAYWGRVEDRLFKIRNCMDIAGVRRRLELFAPEIDPRFLVRMKAAGLTLDDVLNATSGNLPPYRFTYLIEKAKQHAGTLQSFGAQLLSAIEKRDGEELAQLRAVHEQNLLKMRSRMTQLEIDAAEDAIEGLRRQKAGAEYRHGYFHSLSNVGLLASESKQQQLQREASNFRTQAGLAQVVASILTIIPDAGAPTAMKFGGSQLGAAGRAVAEGLNALAAFNEMGASMAGMESSNRRRDQDWKHQVETAKRDISQIEKQITAAEIKRDIAVHSLEVHDKTIAQAEELFEFFGTKFSSFGRYTYLSNRLHKLYYLAFKSALGIARMTEQAYRAERTDDDMLLDGNYWDAGNAGLLAGERLLIDLQALELKYIETNYRTLEVEQSFSLKQFDPSALLKLQKTGECDFGIPEIFFDMNYPGHYRRRVKAVRLTIPCVTGPYTNVGATLRLTGSWLRKEPTLVDTVPLRHTTVIATSTAQNDAGVFEFSFRDEQYMPFEGAGAISDWTLTLPKNFRPFDYQTISDVILRISYTAKEDGILRTAVEASNSALENNIEHYLSETGVFHIFSLRREFPDVWHRLVQNPVDTPVEFELTERHIPLLYSDWNLKPSDVVDVLLETSLTPTTRLEFDAFTLSPPATPTSPTQWVLESDGLHKATVSNVTVLGRHIVTITSSGNLSSASPGATAAVDESKLTDIFLRMKLRVGVRKLTA